MSTAIVHRARRWRALLAAAVALAAAIGFGAAAEAQAASYYTIVNTGSGLALEATTSGKVRLAPVNKTNLLQQWKRVNTVNFSTWSESAVQNRLLGCLRSDSPLNPVPIAATLKVGNCAGASSDMRKRWSHLSGSNMGTPNLPGVQLVNSQTAEYAADFDLCFENCPVTRDAGLLSASFFDSIEQALAGYGKWSYKFAVSAP
jgi:hypothetical protein